MRLPFALSGERDACPLQAASAAKGGGQKPSAFSFAVFSAHFRDDVVHGVVHGDTQLVDTLTHLRFHGIPAVGRHHPHSGAGHQASAHTDPKSGTCLHNQSLLFGMGIVWPPLREKNAVSPICQKLTRAAYLWQFSKTESAAEI